MVIGSKQIDPIRFSQTLWPGVHFYDKQIETIYSVWNNDETIVPAGNMLGKDFVAGRLILLFFLTRYPCRIVTTSAKDDHLRVLWGEMLQAVQESAFPLEATKGGPLILTHREIKRIYKGQLSKICYIKGMVAGHDSIASMQGHHVANRGDGIFRTLFVSDESSSVEDEYYKMARTWANSMLIFGNTWPCANYFYRAIEGDPATGDPGGDILADDWTVAP